MLLPTIFVIHNLHLNDHFDKFKSCQLEFQQEHYYHEKRKKNEQKKIPCRAFHFISRPFVYASHFKIARVRLIK